MSAFLGVVEATGRGLRRRLESHTPARLPTADAVRFDCDRSMGTGGPPSAGGPKKRRGAPARSIATNYKVS